MTILLIQPPIRDFYRTRFREYPLGLMYLAASLERAGFRAQILDARRSKRPKAAPLPPELYHLRQFYTAENDLFIGFKHFGLSFEEIAREAAQIKPDAICISSMFTPYVGEVIETAAHIKALMPDVPIIAGGHHATSDPQSLIGSGHIDCAITGEGEESLPSIISTRQFDSIVTADPVAEIGALPFPARHLINPAHYLYGNKRYSMILTSRGCPHGCSFCSVHNVVGRKHRVRPIEDVLVEIDECINKYGIRALDFQDDNLLFDSGRIKIISEKIIERYEGNGLELLASNGLNAGSIDEELLRLMKKAGFKKLDIALGTGGVPSRRNLKRPEEIEHYERVIDDANRLGIPVTTYIILGLPEQPISEMRETIEYLKDKDTLIAPSIFYNVPGMPIFDEMQKYEYSPSHISRRSSAFNSFGRDFTRDDIFKLFQEIRRNNLAIPGN